MSEPILINGTMASGKSYSLRNLPDEVAKRTLHVNTDRKNLPWMGEKHFVQRSPACPTLLPKLIHSAGTSEKFDIVCVDTITLAMQEYASKFINSNYPKYHLGADNVPVVDANYVSLTEDGELDSRGGWGRYAALVADIINEGKKYEHMHPIFFAHIKLKADMDTGAHLNKANLQGSVGSQGVESMFNIVATSRNVPLAELASTDQSFLTMEESMPHTKSKFVFQVQHTEETVNTDVIRSPEGLWPKDVAYIDADLNLLTSRIREMS